VFWAPAFSFGAQARNAGLRRRDARAPGTLGCGVAPTLSPLIPAKAGIHGA